MTYDPTIPQANELISTSQGQILINFSQLNTQFGVDHMAFNTGSGNGDGTHKKITFDAPPAAPTPSGTISNMYPAAVSTEQEMMWVNATHTTQVTSAGLPIWKGGTVGTSGVIASMVGANGYITLPNGLIFQWGSKSSPGSSGTITFATANISFPNACFNVQLTVRRDSSSSSQGMYINGTPTKLAFSYNGSSGSANTLYWWAVGN